ncbi:winged helix-turn-helix domain-containing protein [Thermoflexus sp.]|uniref:winged helix-turn-helix domain-containing protein n=1 Tax=Thermoflexus sp. TaxID=1969742 RepID=UPI0025DA9231|nr:transcriptional regulator [Thermoflexus sp.]MDW8181616.1 transcriptional regulator [Anaerolineae bacterium]MCS6964380.1 transcriptional regulator [Thermoflexus sp.]MCS7352155.1 transcriptional regulator [Thermoflexus sp.]MCX7689398.1 transcriptional regulator [Thermoflexus sp.]MDW8185092.1 transcriptional regulator [Anaerolineae bacterium]
MDIRDLDPIIHERVRLGILTLLLQAGELDFQTLKRELEVTDGNLAQHLRVLEEHGLIEVHKAFVGRRPRTTYTLTSEGRRRLRAYLDRLAELLRSVRRRRPESR